MWCFTNNAKNYRTYLLPVISPIISKIHGLTLAAAIHPETVCRKSLVDAHLANVMRHVNAFFKETGSFVSTSDKLIKALNQRGSV